MVLSWSWTSDFWSSKWMWSGKSIFLMSFLIILKTEWKALSVFNSKLAPNVVLSSEMCNNSKLSWIRNSIIQLFPLLFYFLVIRRSLCSSSSVQHCQAAHVHFAPDSTDLKAARCVFFNWLKCSFTVGLLSSVALLYCFFIWKDELPLVVLHRKKAADVSVQTRWMHLHTSTVS